jgi:hypothetical protein
MLKDFQEFQVEGNAFKQTRPMGAKVQFHVLRRLSPLMDAFRSVMQARGATKPENMLEALTPLARELSALPDADCDYVFDECLSLVSIKRGNAWQPVWDRGSHALMHEDITMSAMLMVTVSVIQESLASFLPNLSFGSLPGSGASTMSQSGSPMVKTT